MEEIEKLKYPVGKLSVPKEFTSQFVEEAIRTIEDFPDKIKRVVEGMNDTQLDTRYREGGWTVRQVVHHVADSHMNAYIRLKLTLTESNPTIKPYEEALWAELPDGKSGAISPTLSLLQALHLRWVNVFKQLNEAEWQKTFFHPETKKTFSLQQLLAIYEWHCRHHLAHITSLINRNNW